MSGRVPFADHVIDESVTEAPSRRPTRAEQRAATRESIVRATADCLVAEGYAGVTTRRVAQRAGVAQSTVMHHFETREVLLVEAVEHLAVRLAANAFERIDLAALRTPDHRAAVLDEAWVEFTSPESLAAAQVWAAVWAEPELAPTLRELETRVTAIIVEAARALFPELADDPRLPALIDSSVALIRGLAAAIPIWGGEAVTARWEAIKPLVVEAAAHLLDEG